MDLLGASWASSVEDGGGGYSGHGGQLEVSTGRY